MGIKDKLKFRPGRRTVVAIVVAALALGGAATYHYLGQGGEAPANAKGPGGFGGPGGPGGPRGAGNRPQPVKAATVRIGDLDIVVTALGTVTASNTAIVKPRVDGQLIRINFREGQVVKAGDLLAEIDPRPFQIALEQASGQLAKDEALLAAARVDLERYKNLLAKDSIAKQQVDTQDALVRQYRGVVESDKAQVDNAKLQLGFTRITAPAAGRLGLRQVDVGNNVKGGDTTGIVVITQTRPIHTVFAIPAETASSVVTRLAGGASLEVEAWDRDGRTRLTSGRLLSIDNQVDVATGTIKLKAEFANQDDSLLPNQFVNIRLKVETRKDSVLVASAAVQRGAEGSFVYVIDPENQGVKPRPIRLGPGNGELFVVESGLQAGEQVVTDGTDRLKPGGRVEVLSLDGKAVASEPRGGENGQRPRGEGGAGRPGADGNPPAAGAPAASPAAAAAPGGEAPRGERRKAREEGNAGSAPPAAGPGASAGGPGGPAANGERRENRCAPDKTAADPELAARCERWRQRREAEGGGAPREGGRRGE